MATATATESPIKSFAPVKRYPIGLSPDVPTVRWYAEVIVPESALSPCGQYRVDAVIKVTVGDIEYTPLAGKFVGPDPGTRDMARNIAERFTKPLGFEVGNVWFEGGDNETEF